MREQAAKAYMNKDLDQAMEFIEQALEVAPNDSLVLYDLGCLHTLQGHKDVGLEFLQKAVEGGCYCPNRISKDRDWDSVRDNPKFKRALVLAQKMAAESNTGNRESKTKLVRRLVERMGEAAATLDYAATVEITDGHSVRTESVTVLVPDAQEKPIYPVFGRGQSLTDFAVICPRRPGLSPFPAGQICRNSMPLLRKRFVKGVRSARKYSRCSIRFSNKSAGI